MKEREQADIESGPEAVLELERQMMKECFDHILKLSEDNKELHDAIKKKKDTMTK